MRILYLNPSGQLGGAEIMLLNLMASVRLARPDWYLHLLSAQDGPFIERAKALGVHCSVLPYPPAIARLGDSGLGGPAGPRIGLLKLSFGCMLAGISFPGYLRRLRRTIREARPDLVHANGFKMHIFGALSRVPGAPLLWHINDYVQSRRLMAHLLRLFANRSAGAIAVSDSVAKDAAGALSSRLRIFRLYNGIDMERFSPEGERLDLDALAGLPPAPDGTIRVGLIATFARWKGQEVFMKAISLLPNNVPVRAYVIGDAVYQTSGSQYRMDELRAFAKHLGVDDRVGFTSFVFQPALAMRSLDIVVHASTAPEPFGMVIVEAMACGRAIVASAAGGATELFNPGVDALGHESGDAADLAKKIGQLAADPALRARLGNAARLTAAARFDRVKVADHLIPFYGEVSGRCVTGPVLKAAVSPL